jgi:cytochrome c-type biogenesis protein CcmH
MITFWLILIAMTLAALICVAPPLIASPRAMTPRQAALAGALIALVPCAALTMYMRIGDPGALAIDTQSTTEHGDSPRSLEAVITRLAAKLRHDPADVQGWTMLARSYAAIERPDDAVAAYRRALALTPRDADLLSDYADALASANGGDLSGAPQQAIDAALAIAPDHPKALALAGSAALDRREYSLAIRDWERLKAVSADHPEIATQAQKQIDDTRERMAKRTKSSAAQGAPRSALDVRVSLSPALASRVKPTDTVFVYALASDGGRMPLAVQRLRAAQLPATVTLDDSMSMTPERRLSDFATVSVAARVSASGKAEAQPGDPTGTSGAVTRDQQTVDVVIADRSR